MNSTLLFYIALLTCINIYCCADSDNLQDTCPTDKTEKQTIFMNGFPCKNPDSIIASDFKSSELRNPGDTDNFLRSAVTLVTAADFPGLNTLGLSIARTDLELDGIVMPHSHPRASELFFVSQGIVYAGFVDTNKQLFQKVLKKGEVFMFPGGMLHFCLNAGYDSAIIFSVLNSQNPGVVSITDAEFASNSGTISNLVRKFISASALDDNAIRNITFLSFKIL